MPDATAIGHVGPSGKSLDIQGLDGSSLPSTITSVADGNDGTTLLITSPPAGNAFPLTFGGHTTASIPTTATPPASYYLWTMTGLNAAHLQQIGITWPVGVGPMVGGTTLYLEVFNATVVEGAALYAGTMSQFVAPADYTSGTYGDATPIPWNVVGGPGRSFSTTGTLIVRVSASDGNLWYMDAIEAKDLTTNAFTIFDDQDGSLTYFGIDTQNHNTGHTSGGFASVDGTYTQTNGRGTGPIITVTGGAAALQSALEALPSIGAGNVLATFPSPDYQIRLVNALGFTLQSAITTTEPNVTLTHSNPGGNVLAYSINGGSFVPFQSLPFWTTSYDRVALFLTQSSPTQYSLAGDDTYFTKHNPANVFAAGASGREFVVVGGQASPGTLGFSFDRLLPGTYQLAATWDHTTGPPATVAVWDIRDKAGNVLSSGTQDQTVAPSGFTHDGFTYQNVGSAHTIGPYDTNTVLSLNFYSAGSTGNVVADGCILTRTSSDQSITILDTDVVRVQIPADCVATAYGPIAAQTITLDNRVGGSLLGTFAAVPKTMLVGNSDGPPGFSSDIYSNLAYRIQLPMSPGHGNVIASNSDAYPTTIDQATLQGLPILQVATDWGGLGKGLMNTTPGLHTVIWDGACVLNGRTIENGTISEDMTYQHLTGTTDNIRVFNLQGSSTQFTPDFGLDIGSISGPDGSGHFATDIANLRIYPPDPSDPTGMTPWGIHQVSSVWVPTDTVPLFHPNNATKLGDSNIIRFMDRRQINDNTIHDSSDEPPTTYLSRRSTRKITTNIVSITNPGAVPVHFCIKNFTTSLVETDAPHGLFNYAGDVRFQGGGTATYADSSTVTFDGFLPNTVWVVDSTHFLMNYSPPNGNPAMTIPVGAGGTVTVSRGSMIPFSEIIDFCNTFNQHLYHNFAYAETDALTTSQMAYAATNLKPGLKLYCEVGNEVWNGSPKEHYSALDDSYQYLLTQGGTAWSPTNTSGVTDGSHTPGLVARSIVKFAIARSAWTTAGRTATDVIRVIGCHPGDPQGSNRELLAQGVAQGMAMEAIGIGCYLDNNVPGDFGQFQYIDDTMTIGPALDQLEGIVAQSPAGPAPTALNIQLTQNNAELARAGYSSVKIINYESAMQHATPGQSPAGCLAFATAFGRHPRMSRIRLGYLQACQDNGVIANLQYFYTGDSFQSGGQAQNWAAFPGFDMLPGTGTNADTANLDTPFDVPNILSEPGGGNQLWASLVEGGSMPSTDLYDRFAGTAGTVLAGGHTSDSGHTWAAIGGDVGLELSGLGNGRVYAATASGGFGPTSSWTPPGADYRSLVRLSVLSTPTTGDVIGLAHRFAPTTGSNFNCYYWVYIHGTGFAIFGSKDGTFAQIGSNFSATIADGNLVDFTVTGTTTVTLTLALNGATILTESDSSSTITAPGSVALLNIPSGGGNTQTTTTGIQHDTTWVGSTAGPSSSISPSSPSVALSGTQAFTSSQSAGLSGVSPAIVYTWTATHGSFSSGTGVAGATYTAPASGTSDTVTATNVDLSTLVATDAVTLTSSVTDYYVAASGSDSNPGSSGSPFLTIAHAISASSAGNTIHLNGGDTFAEAVGLTSGRTITSYGTGRATIAPASVDPTAGVPVTATNCDGVNLTNLIHKAASTLVGAVVYLDNTDGTRRTTNGVSVVGCDISGAMNGIVASSASGGGLNGVTISDNTIHDLLNFGVYTTKAGGASGNCYSNVQVHDNTIYNITGNSTTQGTGIALGNCDSTTGTNAAQCVIQHNHIYNCGSASGGSAGPAGSFPINSDGVLTQFNVVHDISSGTSNVDGVAFDHDIGTSNCTTQYNYAYNCEGSGFLLDGAGDGHVLRWNVFVNCASRAGTGAGIRLDTPGGIQVYNNTILTGSGPGISMGSGHSVGKKVYNNAFVVPVSTAAISIVGAPDATCAMEGNAYQSAAGVFNASVNGTTYSSLAAFITGTSLEATGHGKVASNPFASTAIQAMTPATIGLMTAFILNASASPSLVGAAIDLQSVEGINPGTVDFLGNALGSPYSIGGIDARAAGGTTVSANIHHGQFPRGR